MSKSNLDFKDLARFDVFLGFSSQRFCQERQQQYKIGQSTFFQLQNVKMSTLGYSTFSLYSLGCNIQKASDYE